MLKVEIPQDKSKMKQQIKELESILALDNSKDKQMHQQSIKDLQEALLYICYLELQNIVMN